MLGEGLGKGAFDDARFDMFETQARPMYCVFRVDERGAELFDRVVVLRQGHVFIFLPLDAPQLQKGLPDLVEGIEHVHAAGIAEIAPLFVATEVDQYQLAAGFELGGAMQQNLAPVPMRLRTKPFQFLACGADRLHVVRDIADFLAHPVHRGGGKPDIERARRNNLLVKTRTRNQRKYVIESFQVGVERAKAINVCNQRVEIVARLVGVDDRHWRPRAAFAHRPDRTRNHRQRGAGIGGTHVG